MMKFSEIACLVFLFFSFFLLSACGVPVLDDPTPTPNEIQLIDQIPPSSPGDSDEYQIRSHDGMNMIHIPGGAFPMGSTDSEIRDAIALCQQHYPTCNRWYYERESPQHTVFLDGFWIDQNEVSNAQYRLCVEAGICKPPVECDKGTPTFPDLDKLDYPVICVNWEEARDYCQWVDSSLPTEAEWEYVFRGKMGLIYPWGNEFNGNKLNYCDKNCTASHADGNFDDGYIQTAPVGIYPQGKSWSGVLDLGGNVSEWVDDWLDDYSFESESNPSGPLTGKEKMIKGCSWFFHPTYCRGAARHPIAPDNRVDYIGFRCVRPAEKETGGGVDINLASLAVPLGTSPSIDGTISEGEWTDASVESFEDGSELFLKNNDGYLYLGIRVNSPGMIVGNVFIHSGSEVVIMHSSAALGTAIYQEGGDGWFRTQNFTWKCRNSSDSEAAQSERAKFLEDEGWLASNGRMGTPEEVEFRIELSGDSLQLAVNFIRASNTNEKIPWPADLNDDCIKLTPRGLPEILFFSPEKWETLEILN